MHRALLALDRFDQFELGAAAIQVMPWPVDAEVGVAAEVIGQEAQTDFEGDEFAGECDVGFLGPGQETACAREITRGELLEHWHLHFDLG